MSEMIYVLMDTDTYIESCLSSGNPYKFKHTQETTFGKRIDLGLWKEKTFRELFEYLTDPAPDTLNTRGYSDLESKCILEVKRKVEDLLSHRDDDYFFPFCFYFSHIKETEKGIQYFHHCVEFDDKVKKYFPDVLVSKDFEVEEKGGGLSRVNAKYARLGLTLKILG